MILSVLASIVSKTVEPDVAETETKKEEQSNSAETNKELTSEETEKKEEEQPASEGEKVEEKPKEFCACNVCISLLRSYGRIDPPSVQNMINSVDDSPAWEQGETVTPDDIRQLYLRNGITIAFWNREEPMGKLTEAEKTNTNRANYAANSTTTSTSYASTYSTSSYWSRKEKGITIHVDEDSDDEEETNKDATKKPEEKTATEETSN